MNISKNNYEIFFIDYYDGNLNADQTAALFLFLESYPELKEEFENFSPIILEASDIQFPDRDSMKKEDENISDTGQLLVAELEGDITPAEQLLLDNIVAAQPAYKKDREIYKATISVPDYSIVYPDKRTLKKPVPFFVAYRNEIRYGIAAILLLGFITGMVNVFNRTM